MKNSKTIIGFINTTLKGYNMTIGNLDEERTHKIISAIIGDLKVNDKTTKEVILKMNEFYNYPMIIQ